MISIHKTHLLLACKHLQRVVSRNATLPSLACIKIEPAAKEIRFVATDLDRAVHITIPATWPGSLAMIRAKKEGALLVNAGVLANAAATADSETFLHIGKDSLQVTIDGQLSTIPTATEGDPFDVSPLVQSDWMPVDGQFDLDTIKRLLRAASKDEARYTLQGIFWDREGRLIATDGRRMILEPFPALPEIEGDIIIPTDTCQIIPPRAAISIGTQPNRRIAFVATENILTIRIFSKLVDGNYPNWRQVVPEAPPNSIRFNNQDAATSIRKLNKISSAKKDLDSTLIEITGPSRISFTIRKDGQSCGSFSQAAVITGDPQPVAYNTSYLIDALESGGDTFSYRDSLSPALISGVKKNTQILMPLRISATPTPEPEPEPETEPEPDSQPA
jgi:DNA polymerase-3 subunit beta